MKCRMNEAGKMRLLLAVGLVLAFGGFAFVPLTLDAPAQAQRIVGMVSGLGCSLAAIGGGVLLWRRAVGEKRARESTLAMNDERGQMIAYKAQSVTAIAAVAALILLMIAAVVRGDRFYMLLGTALCLAVGAVKAGTLWFYGRRR